VVYDKNIDDSNAKEIATETLVCVLERIPSIAKSNTAALKKVIEVIFYGMV
jgi:hypothetical protein